MSGGPEKLITEGFAVETISVRGETLGAMYGAGYGEGVRVGPKGGLKSWKIKVSALPDFDDYQINAGEFGLQTRWQYVEGFYTRHNVENWHKVFRFVDPKSRREYLADIAEEQLDMQTFSLFVATVGLTIRQRRVYGVESPSDPVAVENNAEI